MRAECLIPQIRLRLCSTTTHSRKITITSGATPYLNSQFVLELIEQVVVKHVDGRRCSRVLLRRRRRGARGVAASGTSGAVVACSATAAVTRDRHSVLTALVAVVLELVACRQALVLDRVAR
jgi:hypothetical protein